MSVEEQIYTRLSGLAGLAALVDDRIYPKILEQNCTLPAITYQRVSSERISAMGVDTDIVRARFQISAWAETYTEMVAVAEQIRLALQRYRITTGTKIDDCFMLPEVDLFEEEIRTFQRAMDFEIIYRE